MHIINTRELNSVQKETLYTLWNAEYPVNLNYATPSDFENYLNGLVNTTHYFLMADDTIMGWSFTFDRNGEKWFGLILDTSIHQKGYGTIMLNEIKQHETNLYGWVMDHNRDVKINGQPYNTPLGFYLKNGFTTYPDIRIDTEKISAVKIGWMRG